MGEGPDLGDAERLTSGGAACEAGRERQAILALPSGLLVRARFLGAGPPVVLLHESPRSSAAVLPLAERLAPRFACVCLDLPGFGLSDPMPMARPEAPDFAAVVLEAMAALGLPRCPVYGSHTGAALAAAAAEMAPERVSAAVLDGYAAFTPGEQAELLASYLPPFRPTLDGTHVAWLWARVRDQVAAFPWNRVSDACRLPFGPPPLAALQAVVEDFLLAGDRYRIGYAAAFRYDHLEPLRRACVPIRVACREDDVLLAHMERTRGVGAETTLHRLSADRDLWAGQLAALIAADAGEARTDAAALAEAADRLAGGRRMVETPAGAVAVRLDGPADGAPVVLLHDAPGGMADQDGLAARLARAGRRVVRANLPALGATRLAPGVAPTVEAMAGGVAAALRAVGAEGAPVVAQGASFAVAARIGGRLLLLDPWPIVAEGVEEAIPDLAPRWDGTHLTAAFWWARDHELFKPWCARDNATAREIGPERDAERINHRFRAITLGGPVGAAATAALYRAARETAAPAGAVALLHPGEPDFAALRDRSAAEGIAVREAPREPAGLARAVLAALG